MCLRLGGLCQTSCEKICAKNPSRHISTRLLLAQRGSTAGLYDKRCYIDYNAPAITGDGSRTHDSVPWALAVAGVLLFLLKGEGQSLQESRGFYPACRQASERERARDLASHWFPGAFADLYATMR